MRVEVLKEFIQLAETRNFTVTAKKLFLSQSTLSNHIAELEKEIGFTLFSREKQQLTEEGELFLEAVLQATTLIDESIEKCIDIKNQDAQVITIRLFNDPGYIEALRKRIISFCLINPQVKIKYIPSDSKSFIIDDINLGLADCGMYGSGLTQPSLDNESEIFLAPLNKDEVYVWLDKSSEYFERDALAPNDIKDLVLLIPGFSRLSTIKTLTLDFFRQYGVTPRYKVKYASTAQEFIVSDHSPDEMMLLGKSIMEVALVKSNINRMGRPFNPPIFWTNYLVFKKQKQNNHIEQFSEFIVQQYEQEIADINL